MVGLWLIDILFVGVKTYLSLEFQMSNFGFLRRQKGFLLALVALQFFLLDKMS